MPSRETKQYNAGSVPRAPDLILFGGAMKKLKGLWFLGFGLIMLIAWEYLSWRFWSEPFAPGALPPNPFLIVLVSLEIAVDIALHPTTTTIVFSLYSITMFALVAIGLFRLVWSSFHTWGDEEQE